MEEQQAAEQAAAEQAEREREQHIEDIIVRYYDTGEIDDELSYAFGREDGYMHGEEEGVKRVYAAAYAEGEESRRRYDAYMAEQRRLEEKRKKEERAHEKREKEERERQNLLMMEEARRRRSN